MKIEEKFYTLSHSELKFLCKKHSLRFQKGFDETEFLIFFEDNKDGSISQNRMSQLTFSTSIDNDKFS